MQGNLFAAAPEARPTADARLSPCGRYRYWLARPLGPGSRVVFCMLNPSTADARVDDPTIRRCMGFARALGFGTLEVVNLFAWRSTDPEAMFAREKDGVDIIGPDNDLEIVNAARGAGMVIAAWGADPRANERARAVLALLSPIADVHCLARSKDGAPRHPLYLKADLRPEVLQPREGSCA